MRRWLPAIAYDRPVTALMLFVALLVVGLIAQSRIPLQMMPRGFEPRFLWVRVSYAGASPLEVDEEIVREVEAQLGTVPGIKTLTSNADNDGAGIGIEFHSSVDMDVAYNAVVDRMERALVGFPEGVDRYFIWKYNPDDEPILWTGVSLPEDVDDPYHVMSRIVEPQLQRIPGVAAIDSWGLPQRSVYIDYDREKVIAHGVNLGDVQRRLSSDNFQMAGGKLRDHGELLYVRSLARLESVEDLRRFPVKEGVVLADIADVQLRSAYSSSINRIAGQDGVALAIRKESTANTVEVSKAVIAVLEELQKDPRLEGAEFFTFFNQGELVEGSVDTLQNTMLTGGVFAVIILYLFLREWRMTLLIALSIPFSLLITIGVLYFRGDTMNLLSMMGLMLAVGMVVDNAIVVIETIYRRRAEGAGMREAAVEGSSEVNLAILMSTLTTMVVFLPLILMSESVEFSFFMGVLGLPVVFALAASLLVATYFAPLATRLVGAAEVQPDARWLVWLTDSYAAAMRWVLAHRVDAAVLLAIFAVLTYQVPFKNAPEGGESQGNLNDFRIRFSVPPEASLRERYDIVETFEQYVEDHREDWGVRVYRSRLSSDSTRGQIYVYLGAEGATVPRDKVIEDAKKSLPDDVAGVTAQIGWEGGRRGSGSGGNTATLRVSGEDMATLVDLSREVVRRAETVEGVLAAHLDFENTGAPEIRLRVHRESLARYGLNAQTVGGNVSWAMRANRLPSLQLADQREIGVQSSYALEDRATLEALLDHPVWSPSLMRLVPIRALTDTEVGKGPSSIRREDRETSLSVSVDLSDELSVFEAYSALDEAMADMKLPRGYRVGKGQEWSMEMEDDQARNLAMLLSIVFVFLLMGVLFESYLIPITIITTIPMAMMGAWWGLWLTNTPMDMMAGIGLVILVGVVVNNGIVLIDLVTQLIREGMDRDLALVEAGRRRLRPILMTALTTICGLIPMSVGSSSFIGIPYAPLGRIVIGGMVASTILTLLFIPFLYALLVDVRSGFYSWLAFVRGTKETA
ncbi:MAG: efflux RND transporter permease subunit [Deltaproteobacteria bacterium]|nr:MAG: efflux RND transporter permease subunit [Deltaproteobacteria bacterium]